MYCQLIQHANSSRPNKMSYGHNNSSQSGCGFCRRNRESPAMVASHKLKDEQGRVMCPQLRRYRCPGCGATGDEAHTRSYCPNVVSIRNQYERRNSDSNSSTSPPSGSRHAHPQPRPRSQEQVSQQAFSSGGGGSQSQSQSSQRSRAQELQMYRMARIGLGASSASDHSASRPSGRSCTPTSFNEPTTTTASSSCSTTASQTSGIEVSPELASLSQQDDTSTNSSEADTMELTIELGANRSFYNMSRVTNSRYNSAGQLRNRHTRPSHNHRGGGHRGSGW